MKQLESYSNFGALLLRAGQAQEGMGESDGGPTDVYSCV